MQVTASRLQWVNHILILTTQTAREAKPVILTHSQQQHHPVAVVAMALMNAALKLDARLTIISSIKSA